MLNRYVQYEICNTHTSTNHSLTQTNNQTQTKLVWFATLGAGDYLFTPVNMIVRESVLSEDVFGLRYSCVVPNDIQGLTFFDGIAKSKATPSNHLTKAFMALVEKSK